MAELCFMLLCCLTYSVATVHGLVRFAKHAWPGTGTGSTVPTGPHPPAARTGGSCINFLL